MNHAEVARNPLGMRTHLGRDVRETRLRRRHQRIVTTNGPMIERKQARHPVNRRDETGEATPREEEEEVREISVIMRKSSDG